MCHATIPLAISANILVLYTFFTVQFDISVSTPYNVVYVIIINIIPILIIYFISNIKHTLNTYSELGSVFGTLPSE